MRHATGSRVLRTRLGAYATFCPNPDCPDKGQQGRGNIGIHSQKEQRYRCTTCRDTFAATRGTALYRLHHPVDLMVLVVTLLCHGCPTHAIVAAFGLDERTVAAWLHRAGGHAARVHAAAVETGQVDLGQVQADEICVKVCRGRIWQAMALAVPSRLCLGGDLSSARDGALVTATLRRVAALRRLRRAQLAEARRIRQAVTDGYTLTPVQLTSPCRVAVLAEARQVAMHLMRTRLTWPMPARNRAFPCERIGQRDHSTVLHGVAVIAARLASGRQEDAYLRHMVRALGATLDATYEAEGRPYQRAA